MKRLSLAGVLVAGVVAAAPAATAAPKGLTVDDMLAMQRVEDPVPSPDGKWLAFAVREPDLDANRGRYDVWLAAADGSSVTRLTTSPENDTDPAWSRDGKWIYFLSSRGGARQVRRISPAGGARSTPARPTGIRSSTSWVSASTPRSAAASTGSPAADSRPMRALASPPSGPAGPNGP